MSMPQDDMMKLVLDSKALSIWNRKTGPVFWYAAGVPGPFYLNTEIMVGKALSEELLAKITSIVADNADPAARAAQLNKLILGAYVKTPAYQGIIEALVAKTHAVFPNGSYDVISGGERRDWLFSIPLAKELGVRHTFLFKNKTLYAEQGIEAGERALHVSDLINNAASYFDAWLPVLDKEKLRCIGTLCVNTRGSNGITRLKDAGYTVAALNNIDLSFFEKSLAGGLIDQATFDEIATFFASSKDWAAKYLMGRADLFDVKNLDPKSFERLQSFFTQDPWGLRARHAVFFDEMTAAITARKAA